MDAIDQALAQVKSEIEHTRAYLAKLQEAEQELIRVREARHALAQVWNPPQAPEAAIANQNSVRNSETETPVPVEQAPQAQLPLPSEIVRLLRLGNRAMTPAEIDAELRAAGRSMHENAVTSALSKLVKKKVLQRRAGARYSLPSRASELLSMLDGVAEKDTRRSRPRSIASQAYDILREAGKPMAAKEIVAALRESGQAVNPRSVITALYHYAQDGQLFRRLGSRTFGLLAWPEQSIGLKESRGGVLFTEDERHLSTNANNNSVARGAKV